MKRVLEPGLMNDPEQAAVYAGAGLDSAYYLFVWCFQKYFPDLPLENTILDLGCGTAGIAIRLAKLFPRCKIDGVDGAYHMLEYGRKAVKQENLECRVKLIQGILPDSVELRYSDYGVIVSNSFLHHLADPMVLWDALYTYAQSDAAILVIDLLRPSSEEDVQDVVGKYMQDGMPLLRQDMMSSLRSAFTMEELETQLQSAGLAEDLHLTKVSPFQFAVYGRLTGNCQ